MNNDSMTRFLSALLLGALSMTVGCSANADTDLRAAIVADADLVAKVDFVAMRKTPIIQRHQKTTDGVGTPHGVCPEAAGFCENVRQVTGLSRDDFVSFLFTCNLGTLRTDSGASPRDKAASVDGVAALALTKPFPVKRIKHSLIELGGTITASQITSLTINSHPALMLQRGMPSEPDLFVGASKSGRTIYFATTKASLADALDRSYKRKYVRLPPGIAGVGSSLPEGTQMMLSCVVPSSMRAFIRQQIDAISQSAAKDPGAMVGLSFVRLFKNIRTLSFGIKFDTEARVGVAADLGGATEAQQTATLLQTIAVPMIQASLLQNGDPAAAQMSKTVSVTSKDTAVRMTFRMSEQGLTSLLKDSIR